MKKFMFEMITSPLSLFENPIYNYVAMTIIGYIAYKIAFSVVGELGFRGEIGSISHWIIRIFVFIFVWTICCIVITLVTFIIENWIIIIISTMLLFTIYILKIYANKNPTCILNKEILLNLKCKNRN